jgi:hypothetical protein
MHSDPNVVTWPDYQEFYRWLCQEVDGLTEEALDFDSQDPAQEWMWWSIRRQVSHMAWDLLIVMYRRCHMFLWPDGNIPAPIRWEDHRLGAMKYDRVLDESLFWSLDVLLEKVQLGVDWATKVVTTVPVATLRATESMHRGTPFWRHVIQVLPREFHPLHARSLAVDALLRGAHASLHHPAPQTCPGFAHAHRHSSGGLSDLAGVHRRGRSTRTKLCAAAQWHGPLTREAARSHATAGP